MVEVEEVEGRMKVMKEVEEGFDLTWPVGHQKRQLATWGRRRRRRGGGNKWRKSRGEGRRGGERGEEEVGHLPLVLLQELRRLLEAWGEG